MTVLPAPYLAAEPCGLIISPGHPASAVCDPLAIGNSFTGFAATWPSANLLIGIPFMVSRPVVVRQISHENGAAVSGNVDVGIYDELGTRLVSKGSTAQSGTSTIQVHDVTDTILMPGVYFVAMALDNATGQIVRSGMTLQNCRVCGMVQMATAFALPATATLVGVTNAYTPALTVHCAATV